MSRALVVGMLAYACLIAVGGAATAEPDLDTAAVDALFDDLGAIPGAAVAITHGADVRYVRGYGHDSSGAPVTPDTPFRIASVSKSFTALAVMQLVDDGSVVLDAPVTTYLPEFVTADPRSDRITVRQLLHQSSGMADGGFPEASLPQPASLAEAVGRLSDARLVADPGTQWHYHNPNYQVAARLVEVVSGEPFADYLRRHVFGPLGMDHSVTTATDDEPVPGLADGHAFVYARAVALPAPGYFVMGSGGVVSTAADMARWLAMHGNGGHATGGGRIVSTRSLQVMRTPWEPGGYAFGWDTDGPPARPTRIEHGGAQFTFSAHAMLLPESGYGIGVLFNGATPVGIEQMNVIEALASIVEGRAPSPPAPVSSSTLDLVLAGLTLGTLVLGTAGVARSARWAARARGRPVWRTALRLAVHALTVAACLAFPTLAGLVFGGRDVTWRSAAYGWFALVVLVIAVGLTQLAVVVTRASRMARLGLPESVRSDVDAATTAQIALSRQRRFRIR